MKLLVIRMSSLGDVILATAFLESLSPSVKVDWVVAKEFAFVLRGHPRIQNLIEFDKRTGYRGWIRLITELAKRDYDSRVDLHVTLRSLFARMLFHRLDSSRGSFIPWQTISKQRLRFYAYLVFKGLWPSSLRPTPLWTRFAKLGLVLSDSKSSLKPPNMSHQVTDAGAALEKYNLQAKSYFVVMPSSRWNSKEWGVASYTALCLRRWQETKLIPVVMGRTQDRSAVSLVAKLKELKVDHRAVLTEDHFPTTATLIQNALFYVGGDTGLAHFAEAVGTKAIMIFGPTRPDLGFGPWRRESKSVFSDVICSPCSKDGRICYRFTNRYECLKRISVAQVEDTLR